MNVAKIRDEFMWWQLDLLFDLLEGRAAVVYCAGMPYAVHREGDGLVFRCLREETRYVVSRGHCTCPDNRFRGRECKHIVATGVFDGR